MQSGKTAHVENHRVSRGALFRSVILGGQDGVVNVLGIVLGVATATDSAQLVLIAGLAATFAESVSMAAVAYTSSRAEEEHYQSEVSREIFEMENMPEAEREEIAQIFRDKGFKGKLLDKVVDTITSNKRVWLETMMREELRLGNPAETMSPLRQSVIVGVSAIVGSLIPIAPFFFLSVGPSMVAGLAASLAVLFATGAYKSRMTSGNWLRGGLELMLIGGAAALAGYLVGFLLQVPAA